MFFEWHKSFIGGDKYMWIQPLNAFIPLNKNKKSVVPSKILVFSTIFHGFPEITEESTHNCFFFFRWVKVFELNLFWGENFVDESFLVRGDTIWVKKILNQPKKSQNKPKNRNKNRSKRSQFSFDNIIISLSRISKPNVSFYQSIFVMRRKIKKRLSADLRTCNLLH